jgi:outer membrane protein OmpA-like peptidoglycan-associated protein
MKKYLPFFIYIISFNCFSQQVDTLVYAQGKIISALTKEPVVAQITYESLPYGNRIGYQSGSSFSFPLFDKEKYSITVEAPGFAPSKYLLDPEQANEERRVRQDIELGLPLSATDNAVVTHTVGKVLRLDNLIFRTGSATIEPSSFEQLNEILNMLETNPRMVIQLEGHTDYLGSAKLNMKLSEDRVSAVKNYLVSKGASKGKIKTKAFGGTQPLSREDTEEAHNLNRRVEVRILEN